ncbi:MAG: hypothetical protein LBE09_07755 [Christensenellaceae bacterium]|jgi:hypothetical protein|nr:hypothetical protein [Christensenellaceae bacterium]
MGNNLNAIKAKLVLWRVLKIAAYAIGFPLLLYLLKKDITNVGVSKNGYNVIYYGFLGVIALQIIVGIFLRRREFYVRALIVVIVASAVVLAPTLYMEFTVKSEFEKLEEEYAERGYSFARYETQVMDFSSRLSSHNSASGTFSNTYNLNGDTGSKKGNNFDNTPTTSDLVSNIYLDGFATMQHYVFGAEEAGGVYSMNGLYADAFVVGVKQARYILEVYHETRAKFAADNLDADAELEKELEKLDEAGSLWKQYQNTAEYKRAYGDAPVLDAPATDESQKIKVGDNYYDPYWMYAPHYYLTADELTAVVDTLLANLLENKRVNDLLKALLAAGDQLGLDAGTIGAISDALENKNLSLENILDIVNSSGLLNPKDENGKPMLDEDGNPIVVTIGINDIMEVIGTLSYYQSPTTYPKMFFIQNKELRTYAYAKYFGTKHGAVLGTVLIGDSVGKVTMDSSGNPPMSYDEITALFNRLDIENEYMPKYYPWLAIRRTLIKYTGFVPLGLILAYLFAFFERKQFSKLTVAGKGGYR